MATLAIDENAPFSQINHNVDDAVGELKIRRKCLAVVIVLIGFVHNS
jgi:hypothetical protein